MLTPPETELEHAARRALAAWDLDVRCLELVSRTENVVFKVTTRNAAYALRLHRPGYHTLAELESELAWTEALSHAGLETPAHVLTRERKGYAPVSIEGLAETVHAGLIEWLPGVLMDSLIANDAGALDCFRRLGEILARFHAHAVAWRVPEGFVRPAWDADGLVGSEPVWGRFWLTPQLERAERRLLEQAREALHRTLTDHGHPGDLYSLIHADLHPHNVLVHDGRVQAIDFDDCGFGWHQYDIAVALHKYRNEDAFPGFRHALLRGYRRVRPLDGSAVNMLPIFLLTRTLNTLAWANERGGAGDQERLARLAEAACAEARRFLDR